MGKRALPGIALTGDKAAGLSFARQLDLLGRPADIAVGFSASAPGPAVLEGLRSARQKEMLTLLLTGEAGRDLAGVAPDFCFAVPSADPATVQETHRTLYHILWELIHVFLEHEGLFEDAK
jgi:D-sedoheptulose 7-phosphate isomerase